MIVIQNNQEVLIARFINGQIPLSIQTPHLILVLLAKEDILKDMMMKVVGIILVKNRLIHYGKEMFY
ncbi:hypothetical protein [Bacillus sp. SRB3LM]|uniref:hypothetical protein n=1 Tax=Bacillus sp. SRB3LM TaxID=2608689 RepID=UPI0018C41CE9|nr:hypothetical protein [Bacillus sp. SRB3LM]MBG0970637.1 hypothetical protein [Bacillus sp. SRB3LM]